MQSITTITLTPRTRNRLASYGGKDDTFEQIVSSMLDKVESEVTQK